MDPVSCFHPTPLPARIPVFLVTFLFWTISTHLQKQSVWSFSICLRIKKIQLSSLTWTGSKKKLFLFWKSLTLAATMVRPNPLVVGP